MDTPAPVWILKTRPAAARPRATVLLLLYAIGLAGVTGPWLVAAPTLLSARGALGAAAVFGALLLALGRWFFPSTYRLDPDGITARFLGGRRRYPWSRFRSWRQERGGIYMSPCADPARFDRFRGLFMLVDESTRAAGAAGNRDAAPSSEDARTLVASILKERIGGSDGAAAGSG